MTGIRFHSREIAARAGMSIAAALTAAGERELRVTGDGEKRGLFCGMGVCQECRVDVDGRHGVRACMTSIKGWHDVRECGALDVSKASVPAVAAAATPAPPAMPDVLVIGAGAAGLTAAAILAEAGADTVLVDERTLPGGQFYKQPMSQAVVPASLAGDEQFAAGKALYERAERAGVTIRAGSEVWGAFAPGEFAVFDGHASRMYRPKRCIIATGAFERGLPLPGWTLPGVMTTGAAQTLLRSYGVLPGQRVLVSGNGPLNLQVANELAGAGASVVAVTELAAAPGLRSAGAAMRMAYASVSLAVKGVRTLVALKRAGVPVRFASGLAAIEPYSGAVRASIGPATESGIEVAATLDVDVVCMGFGFQPSNELLRCLGCRHEFDAIRGHLATVRTEVFETSVPGIYAVGDCCGLGGAPAAIEEATIAALHIARSLQLSATPDSDATETTARTRLQRHRQFQRALWELFAAPRFQGELCRPDTLVCRCENVSFEQLLPVLAEDGISLGSVKRRTRLGMGACQGRYCAPVAAAMLAAQRGEPIDEMSYFAPRVPVKPMRIADLINAAGGDTDTAQP